MFRRVMISVLLACAAISAQAQKFSLSTNILDYACLGTVNLDASCSVSRRWSLTAGMRYNPFTYMKGDPEEQMQLRQQSYALGARVWPWHTMSGWWFAGKLRYQEYSFGGVWSDETEEGDRGGMGLYAGYTHMLSKHFNIEFGVGFWGGLDVYHRYSCPVCGLLMSTGKRLFVLPDDLMISIAYVF